MFYVMYVFIVLFWVENVFVWDIEGRVYIDFFVDVVV